MNPFTLILLSFLPTGLWVLFMCCSRLSSFFSALRAVFFGFIAIVLAAAVHFLLGPVSGALSGLYSLFFIGFIEAALNEECIKLMVVGFLPEIRKDRALPRTLLAFAILVGVSFSSFETLVYSLQNPSVLYLRFLTSLCVHASASLFAAVFLIRFKNTANRLHSFWYLGSAVALHGSYNVCMALGGYFVYCAFFLLLVSVTAAFVLWNRYNFIADLRV